MDSPDLWDNQLGSHGPWASQWDSQDQWDNQEASQGPWDNQWDSPGPWDNLPVVFHLVRDPQEVLLAVLGQWVCHPVEFHPARDPQGLHPIAELATCSATLFRGTSEQDSSPQGSYEGLS